jgi:hypothetical protein
MTIDEEWAQFISSNNDDNSVCSDDDLINILDSNINNDMIHEENNNKTTAPKPSNIYISTRTKIAFLNQQIDLKLLFWKIKIIPYYIPNIGVIKKQMKFNSNEPEDLEEIQKNLESEIYYDQHIITNINNPNGRIKFKDVRKISIGICKKDLTNVRTKKKSAFYNCFVMIVRILIDQTYKEFHVKIFNTGKIEIPGIQSEKVFQMLLKLVIKILQPYISEELNYDVNSEETVLINSNFNCGFFINRESLYDILKFKYNIQSIYDPCSYPGIQCKFYFNPDLEKQIGSQISEEDKKRFKNMKQVSFMIFRTGSVLIVGRCDESVLMSIYEFLKIILNNEYKNICQKNIKLNGEVDIHQFKSKDKDKKKKIRRKNITVSL